MPNPRTKCTCTLSQTDEKASVQQNRNSLCLLTITVAFFHENWLGKLKNIFYTYTFYIQNYSVYTFCTSLITITFLFFSINSAHNSTVRSFLCQELQKENNGHSKSTTMRKSFLFVNKATGYQYVTCRGSYLHVLISSHLDLMPGQYSSHSHKQLPLWPWI